MALLIKRNTEILGGVLIPEIYVRVSINFHWDGKSIEVNTMCFSSKETFKSGGKNNGFKVSGIPEYVKIGYDRNLNGNDILLYVHEQLKNLICLGSVHSEPLLDENGNYQFDTSTGQIILNSISTPGFTQDSSVSFLI